MTTVTPTWPTVVLQLNAGAVGGPIDITENKFKDKTSTAVPGLCKALHDCLMIASAAQLKERDSSNAAEQLKKSDCYVIAAGLEDGSVHVMTWSCDHGWETHQIIDRTNNGHHATVTRLQFKPKESQFILASCSSDTSVRILQLIR